MKKTISTLALSIAGTLAFAGAGFVAARGMDDAPRPTEVVTFTDDTAPSTTTAPVVTVANDDKGGDRPAGTSDDAPNHDANDDANDDHGGDRPAGTSDDAPNHDANDDKGGDDKGGHDKGGHDKGGHDAGDDHGGHGSDD